MKKTYQTPATLIVAMEITNQILVNSVQGNTDLTLSKTGGGGEARGRESGYWDDDY